MQSFDITSDSVSVEHESALNGHFSLVSWNPFFLKIQFFKSGANVIQQIKRVSPYDIYVNSQPRNASKNEDKTAENFYQQSHFISFMPQFILFVGAQIMGKVKIELDLKTYQLFVLLAKYFSF